MCHGLKCFFKSVETSSLDEETKIVVRNKLVAMFKIMPEVHTDELRKRSLCVNPDFLVNKLADCNYQNHNYSKKYESQLKPVFDKLGYSYTIVEYQFPKDPSQVPERQRRLIEQRMLARIQKKISSQHI